MSYSAVSRRWLKGEKRYRGLPPEQTEGSGDEVKVKKHCTSWFLEPKSYTLNASAFLVHVVFSFSSHWPQDTVCILPGVSSEILEADTEYERT